MSNYTDKEKNIIIQCNNGPYHTLITELSNEEFDVLVDKLINDDDSNTLTSLVSIYLEYDRHKILDYFIDKGDIELLIGFLDYCNDFSTSKSELDQKHIVDRLIDKNDVNLIKEVLDNYIFTNQKEKDRLLKML